MALRMDTSVHLENPPPLPSLVAGGPVSLFLDFDGTLVELAPTPDSIEPRQGLAGDLTNLGARMEHRCAIVSGRAIRDVQRHIGEPHIGWAGSHGLDIRAADGRPISDEPDGFPRDIEAEMRSFAEAHQIDYETKPHGGALHYRGRPERSAETIEFAEALAAQHGWKAQRGKSVVEIIAADGDKGSAVFSFMREAPFAGSRPYFLGDDLTDEAGFEACRHLGGGGILVGQRAQEGDDTHAQYALPDVASVHEWLEL